jgi:type I site-specific restriction-modification system R (restriction) subunit
MSGWWCLLRLLSGFLGSNTRRRQGKPAKTASAEKIGAIRMPYSHCRAARRRGEDEGLSQDEIAFYDALAESQSAVELMGNDSLKVTAHELLVSLKGSVTVD